MTNEDLNKIHHKVQNHQNGTSESKSLKLSKVNKSPKVGHFYGDVVPYNASSLGVSQGFLQDN